MNYISHLLILVFVLSISKLSGQCVENSTIGSDQSDSAVIFTCPGDGRNDLITFTSDAEDSPYLFIITNQNNVILDYRTTPYINFEMARSGVFRVWGLSYNGIPSISRGRKLFSTTLSSDCFALSSNFIEVRLDVPDGGQIETASGAETLSLCPSNDSSEGVTLINDSANAPSYAYLLLDASNEILAITTDANLSFAGIAEGTYQVAGLAYRGNLEDDLMGQTLGSMYLTDDCYGLSDNRLTVNVQNPIAGVISTDVGADTIELCTTDELTFDVIEAVANQYVYLVVDEAGVLQNIVADDANLTVNDLAAGTYSVRGMAYAGELLIATGDTISDQQLASGCYDLSENQIQLEKPDLSIGAISTDVGTTAVLNCATVELEINTSTTTAQVAYLVFNTANEVLQISTSANFTVTSITDVQIQAVAYAGSLNVQVGDTLGQVAVADLCYEFSDNTIEVKSITPAGGTLSLGMGAENFYACPAEAGNLIINITKSGDEGLVYSYLLVDENNIIQQITTRPNLLLRETQAGSFRVIGVAHLTDLIVSVGNAYSDGMELSEECFARSDNELNVQWQEPAIRNITTLDGASEVFTCASDEAVRFDLQHGFMAGEKVVYLLTDTSGIILSTTRNELYVGDLAVGSYFVYGLAYTGQLANIVGQTLNSTMLASGCYALSEDALTINRAAPQMTIVATAEFAPSIDLCVKSNESAVVEVVNTGTSEANYTYILTDELDRIIAAFEDTQVSLDVNPRGKRRIWGVSHTAAISVTPNQVLTQDLFDSNCAVLSLNYVEVNPELVTRTRISSFQDQRQISICYGDGVADYIGFFSETSTSGTYRFLLTDENNIIISTLIGNIQNFEQPGPTRTRVWGVNYTGSFSARVGENINESTLSDRCFAVSQNHIEIIRAQVDAGLIAIEGNSEEVELCAALGETQLFTLSNNSSASTAYSYLILDESNELLAIANDPTVDFGQFEQSYLRVLGIAHTENLSIAVGEKIDEVMLSASCYDISSNDVVLRRQIVDGGIVRGASGETSLHLCPSDAGLESVGIVNTAEGASAYQYIVTNTADEIVALSDSETLDFETLGLGNYQVYGLSYQGELTIELGELLDTQATLATGCFGISENVLSVSVAVPSVDQVTTIDGSTTQVTFVGDADPDLVNFDLPESNGGKRVFVVTNTQGTIIDWSTENSFDFNNFSIGFYRVYGASYTGSILLEKGKRYEGSGLSDGCFDISNNFVQIICAPGNRGNLANTSDTANTIQLTPSVVSESLNLNFTTMDNGSADIQIVNMMGQTVVEQNVQLTQGYNEQKFDVRNLVSGQYYLLVKTTNEIQSISFIKQGL